MRRVSRLLAGRTQAVLLTLRSWSEVLRVAFEVLDGRWEQLCRSPSGNFAIGVKSGGAGGPAAASRANIGGDAEPTWRCKGSADATGVSEGGWERPCWSLADDRATGAGVKTETHATGVVSTQCLGSKAVQGSGRWDVGRGPFATGAFRAPCCGREQMHNNDHHGISTVRIGEASNPGPEYRGGMSVTTANGTSWGTILEWCGHHRGHVICGQGHKVLEEDITYEKSRARHRGWKSLWAPAVPSGTAANQASGGTVVMVRSHIGMAAPPGGEVVVRGHVVAAMVEMGAMGWTVIYSVYGKCGIDLSGANWEMCRAIACHAINHGLPWIAAGDWNFEPVAFRASGWLRQMDAELLAAPVASTTRTSGREGRHIDYFIASKRVAALGPRMAICADATIRTHDAVRLRLPAAPRQFTNRRMVRPTVFPKELPIGPRVILKTLAEVTVCSRAARTVGADGDADSARLLIDEATTAIIAHLEQVLADAYVIPEDDRPRYLGRASGVKYAVGPLLGPRIGAHGAAPAAVRRLRMIQDKAAALAAAASRRCGSITTGAIHLDGAEGEARSRRELLERGRAAISAGHHAAAAAGKSDHTAEVICAAYGAELKYFGKQVENYAAWKIAGAARGCSGDPAPQRDGGTCRQDRSLPSQKTTGDIRDGDLSWLGDIAGRVKSLALRAEEAAEPCEHIQRGERAAAVREWAHAASHAGAAAAHRWTKVPEDWRPETVEEDVDGIRTVTADPGAVIDAECAKWAKLWSPPGGVKEQLDWGIVPELPRPTAEQFRRAARRIPRKTGVGVAGITPSDFEALDDAGIEACIDVMMACESVGYIPRAIALVIVRMIPKKDGGRRPIGLLPSMYRIWAKVRADLVRDWERYYAREYFAAGPGKSAEAAAWRAAFRAELAAASQAESASILWDLLKCFEHGDHKRLAEKARLVGFPIAIARMAIEMYRAERRLVLDEAVSAPINPTRGFMAGCARALALVKVVMIRRVDTYVAKHPRITLDMYVDDVELQATGTQGIIGELAEAARDLRKVLCEELGFPLADDKAQVVASSKEIADGIIEATGGTAGRAAEQAVKLGVEVTSGKHRGRCGGYKRARFKQSHGASAAPPEIP